MATPEQEKEVDQRFQSLESFSWCFSCLTLLVGAEKHDSFWGKKTTQIAQLHRRGTGHDVYIGPNIKGGTV
jgi:hypothetical protein